MEPKTPESTMYLMFENKLNNCWLDSSLAVIAHNKAIKNISDSSPNSKIYEVILAYNQATFILNDTSTSIEYRMKAAKEILVKIQASILQYLQPILKYNDGEPDSAFCALLNLIYESKAFKEHLSIKWVWEKKCTSCGTSSTSSEILKPIITLSKVNTFEPYCPSSIFVCSCKTEQEMKLIYKELPTCLIFHFEKGAGNGSTPPLFFTIQDRKYHLTAVVILEKSQDPSVNHFITWIRDPVNNRWLECNDLNLDIILFSPDQPQFALSDVYMYIFESFDNRGKISNEVLNDSFSEQNLQNVEIIDLSDESEIKDDKSESSVLITSDNMVKNIETSVANLLLKDSADVALGVKLKSPSADEPKSDKSNFEVSVKRKLSEQHLFENSVEESLDVKDELNTMPPTKVSKVVTLTKDEVTEGTHETEETDYDEKQLQMRMQKALLKKDYSRCASVRKSANDGCMSDVHEPKTVVEKSSVNKLEKHHKRMDEMQANDSIGCTLSTMDNNMTENQNLVSKASMEESSKNKLENKRMGEIQAVDSNSTDSSTSKTVILTSLHCNKLMKEKNSAKKQNHVPKTNTEKSVKLEKHPKSVDERHLHDSVDCTKSVKDNNVAENLNLVPKPSVEESSKDKSKKYHKRMREKQAIDFDSTGASTLKLSTSLIKVMKDKNLAESHISKTDVEKSVKSEKQHRRMNERQSSDSTDYSTATNQSNAPVIINVEKCHKRSNEKQANDSVSGILQAQEKNVAGHQNSLPDTSVEESIERGGKYKKFFMRRMIEVQTNNSIGSTASTKNKSIAKKQRKSDKPEPSEKQKEFWKVVDNVIESTFADFLDYTMNHKPK